MEIKPHLPTDGLVQDSSNSIANSLPINICAELYPAVCNAIQNACSCCLITVTVPLAEDHVIRGKHQTPDNLVSI